MSDYGYGCDWACEEQPIWHKNRLSGRRFIGSQLGCVFDGGQGLNKAGTDSRKVELRNLTKFSVKFRKYQEGYKMKAKYYGLGVLSTLLVAAVIWLGVLVVGNTRDLLEQLPAAETGKAESSAPIEGKTDKWFRAKIRDIDQQLKLRYIEEIDKDRMYESALKAYVEGLGDPYTTYFTKEEYQAFEQDMAATYDGIGAPISKDQETKLVMIVSPYKDSPAEKAGLRTGDVILAVNGEDATALDPDEVAKRIRGKKGTQVTLTIQRKAGEKATILEVPIIRDTIEIPTISARMLEDQIGYIAIYGFDAPTADQFKKELRSLQSQGMKGLVIDLRGNPGGYLEIAVQIADEIISRGLVVYIEDKNGSREDFSATNPAKLDLPIAVLVDKGSASASEILAGALKDHNLATIVGTTTFGKGLVQNTFPFADGSALKVTIAKYYTPNGEYIHSKGIEPHVKVELETGQDGDNTENARTGEKKMDNQLQKAWEILRGKVK